MLEFTRTSLDPALQVEAADSRLRLMRRGQMVSEQPAPQEEAAGPWAKAAVELTAAGYQASLPLRRAGTQGLIECFFNEMFS